MSKSVKKDLAYSFAYQILAIVLPLITTPYISRVLGPTKVGEYSYSYAIAYYFVMFTMLGLNNYGNRSVAVVRDDKYELSKVFCSIYWMQLSTGIISLVAYIIYGYFISNVTMTWIMSLYVISAIFDINWFFFGIEQFKLTVTRNSFIKIFTTISIFIFVKNKEDIYLYALIMVLGILISQWILWKFIRKYIHFQRVELKEVIKHIKPNLILFIPIIAVSLYKVMAKIMLGYMTTKTEVGLYESSERIIQIPMALIQSMGTVMLPKMTNLIANHDEKKTESIFSTSIMFVMFLSSSMSLGIMGVARYFVPIYYGNGYLKCIELFQILLPSCIFLAFANVIRTQFLIPRKKDNIFISSVIIGAIVNIIANLILIPRLESIGAAIGTLLAEMVVCIYQTIMVHRDIDILKYVRESLVFVIPAIMMYAILIIMDFKTSMIINLLIHILLGGVCYIVLLLIGLVMTKRTYLIKKILKKG